MSRERLPDRRTSWTQTVLIPAGNGKPQRFYLSVGQYDDGRPGEVWIDAAKEGTFLRGVLSTLARQVSIALQGGTPLAAVVESLKGMNYPPQGKVIGSPVVASCTSVADWVASELEAAYLKPPAVVEPPPKVASTAAGDSVPNSGDPS